MGRAGERAVGRNGLSGRWRGAAPRESGPPTPTRRGWGPRQRIGGEEQRPQERRELAPSISLRRESR